MIAGLVLAAGLGRRMGAVKPLINVNGTPSLGRVLSTIDDAGIRSVVVVLGRDAERIRSAVNLAGRLVVVNPSPERGMASSLTLGISALPPGAEGVLVFHADMPFLQSATVRAVSRTGEEAAIAAPSWKGIRGFPVFFRRDQWDELRSTLRGDTGGKAFLQGHPDRLRTVEVEDPGCVRDIDCPNDLARQEEISCSGTFE
ncbi:MAG: nucleotidyltransferase family protein [Thermotogota bacterium]